MLKNFILAPNICSIKFSCVSNFFRLSYKMSNFYEGSLAVKDNELNLDLTLLGGQSFRWLKSLNCKGEAEWHGVAFNAFWMLRQNQERLFYKVYPNPLDSGIRDKKYYEQFLKCYLRLDFDLLKCVNQWRKAHQHFDKIAIHLKAVRVLNQDPLENIISFICSQNNNIKRISTMVQWLCNKYGEKIGHFEGRDEFSFPTITSLLESENQLESSLRTAKFGYRAKFIAQSVQKINEYGGLEWFEKLRTLPYSEARQELVQLPGIGYKVADCICLMSLNHMDSVPVDTHIFKIAQRIYLPALVNVKSVTPKIYDQIAEHFRKVYGEYAGWAQAIVFCSELQQFQLKHNLDDSNVVSQKKSRESCHAP
uniref:N-glycosylase/DNA lyase n=1 Tax=Glossina palpalis gambiensis TaxID=67801 RepID=A0A1B0APN1_9MUSC